MGGCFGQGCKVTYGYDLVGNDYNGSPNSIKESNDPIDNCPANSSKLDFLLYELHIYITKNNFLFYLASATGHGTFVSGIIGAEDKTYV